MSRRIAIVTTKQPGTNPRMRKNADALARGGFDVHVLYAHNARWADATDVEVLRTADWTFQRVGGHPDEEPLAYLTNRVRRKCAAWMGQIMTTFNPFQERYLKELKRFDPHLVIGHNPGSLPVLLKWGELGPVLFDAEDDHPGEFDLNSPESGKVAQLENATLPSIDHMTAASPLIGRQYQHRFPHLKATTIDNVFDRTLQPEFSTPPNGPLKLVWFSQVVGLDRGLEEFLGHLAKAPSLSFELTIIGQCSPEVQQILSDAIPSDRHQISFEAPLPEKDLIRRLSEHHIGLALETGTTRNRQLCRTNKLFCYPLAGCLTLASDTNAQRQFMEEHPEAGVVFANDEELRSILQSWHSNPSELVAKRKTAWQLAHDTLHWETESKKLLELVNTLIDAP